MIILLLHSDIAVSIYISARLNRSKSPSTRQQYCDVSSWAAQEFMVSGVLERANESIVPPFPISSHIPHLTIDQFYTDRLWGLLFCEDL